MTISAVEIKNIKGIEHAHFKFQLVSNKPNLLVAPNGFGKSSIATAFSSMNSNRLKLTDSDYHKEDTSLAPELAITVNGEKLIANDTNNDIRKKYDVTTIRSGLKAKATKRNMGRFTQASASMEIQSIPVCKIPIKSSFPYQITEVREAFGKNGKILPNISLLFQKPALIDAIASCDLSKMTGKRISDKLREIVEEVNQQQGSIDEIRQWFAENCLERLNTIRPLCDLAGNLQQLGLSGSRQEAFLIAYQISSVYVQDKKTFGCAIDWLDYTAIKSHYKCLLSDFCSSGWQWARLSEDRKSKNLFVKFPKAHQLSNGQRDLITLVVQMHQALYENSKKPLILIIDEVFDYLDDANLVAFQYYVTSLIERYNDRGQLIYPIILTHLDPGIFFDFCFNKHKIHIHYLQAKSSGKAKEALRLIEARDNKQDIKGKLEKYWFHFHVDEGAIREEQWPNSLPNEWRQSGNFHQHTSNEIKRYLAGRNYDPLSVCFFIRIGIEKLVYNLLTDDLDKREFLDSTKKTKNKIDFVATRGIEVPETYYLLGLIYNTNLHWNQGRDYVSPLIAKLNHPTIKNLVSSVVKAIDAGV